MLFWDPTFILLIPAIILALWAQARVHSTYHRYSQVRSAVGLSGGQVARRILALNGLNEVEVEAVAGELSDHYDPRTRTVRLSEGNFSSASLASLAVAAHEVGHAIQHAHGFAALKLRHALLVPANLGTTLAFPLFFVGFIFTSMKFLMDVGIYLFLGALAFQVVTLPVEFDASRRAMQMLKGTGLLGSHEVEGARKVLTAAAWTYVAATAMALTQLLRLLILRQSRD